MPCNAIDAHPLPQEKQQSLNQVVMTSPFFSRVKGGGARGKGRTGE